MSKKVIKKINHNIYNYFKSFLIWIWLFDNATITNHLYTLYTISKHDLVNLAEDPSE